MKNKLQALRKEAQERIALLESESVLMNEDLDNLNDEEMGPVWNRARGQHDAWLRVLELLK